MIWDKNNPPQSEFLSQILSAIQSTIFPKKYYIGRTEEADNLNIWLETSHQGKETDV